MQADARLEEGATYLDLRDDKPGEFTGRGSMVVGAESCIVPKTEVDYPLWNRRIGVTNSARAHEG
jgi:hypothetical protein